MMDPKLQSSLTYIFAKNVDTTKVELIKSLITINIDFLSK